VTKGGAPTPGFTSHSPGGLHAAVDRGKIRPNELVQLVAFTVGAGEYAIDIMRIKEVIKPVAITPIPRAPHFIEGVIELRDAILPIVDVRKRFDLSPTPLLRSARFVITAIDVGGRRMIVGLIVDSVSEPLRIARDQIRPAPSLAQGEMTYFTGVVHQRGRIFMILDLDAILSTKEKLTLAGLGPEGAR
jgi:purine-binding chemotaxis protein CheW